MDLHKWNNSNKQFIRNGVNYIKIKIFKNILDIQINIIIKCYKLILSNDKYDYYIRLFKADRNKELLKEIKKIMKIRKLMNYIIVLKTK